MRSTYLVPFDREPAGALSLLGASRSVLADPIILGLIVAVSALAVAIVLLLRQRTKPPNMGSASKTTAPTLRETPPPPPKRPIPPTTRPAVRKRSRRVIPSREEAVLAEDVGDFGRAASIWKQRGNRVAQLRALTRANDQAGLARLEMALGWPELAIPRLEALIQEHSDDIDLRLKLFHAYLDLDKIDEARALAYAVFEDPGHLPVTAGHLVRLAAGFEAKGEQDMALKFYGEASRRPDVPEDVEIRILYLEEVNRLQDPPETTSGEYAASGVVALALDEPTERKSPSPEEMLDQELDEAAGEQRQSPAPQEQPSRIGRPILQGHEVIVGHLALGGERDRNGFSTRSVASPSSRYKLKRLAGEARHTALFEAVDCLLDCPVAIKLWHVAMMESDFDILRDRLRAIAKLNHPNLTKTTFVDRTGNVVRVVTEYHSGGNLEDMLSRMEKVGLPLMLRLMMQVASGVQSAHSHGIIHGDLRARNIMIGHDQLIKVVDFALAPWEVRRLKPDDSRSRDVLQLFPAEELQTDIRRFAGLLEFILERTVVSSVLAGNFEDGDPLEELREVARRAREGAFSSLTPIQRIFQQILEGIQPMGRAD